MSATCPRCGGRVVAVTTAGPFEHRLRPCNCRVDETTIADLFGIAVGAGRAE